MNISLASNQFIFVNGIRVPTSVGLVGHWCDSSSIPEEGVLEVRSIPSFDGIDYAPAANLTTLFKGSKGEFLRWQEEFNGW